MRATNLYGFCVLVMLLSTSAMAKNNLYVKMNFNVKTDKGYAVEITGEQSGKAMTPLKGFGFYELSTFRQLSAIEAKQVAMKIPECGNLEFTLSGVFPKFRIVASPTAVGPNADCRMVVNLANSPDVSRVFEILPN